MIILVAQSFIWIKPLAFKLGAEILVLWKTMSQVKLTRKQQNVVFIPRWVNVPIVVLMRLNKDWVYMLTSYNCWSYQIWKEYTIQNADTGGKRNAKVFIEN